MYYYLFFFIPLVWLIYLFTHKPKKAIIVVLIAIITVFGFLMGSMFLLNQ